MIRRLGRPVASVAAVLCLLASCSTTQTTTPQPSTTASAASSPPGPSPSGSSASGATPAASASSAGPTATEPTTTNTLPPPPPPTKAAPSTAGRLTARSLPIPRGWRTVARKGGSEEGYQGNGTWVHARDARYAARDAITIGCTEVTRDDYTDPSRALEGSYVDSDGKPGVGLVMQFGRAAEAQAYFDLYLKQVRACTRADGPVVATVVPSALGLIDRRTYPGEDEWTEMGRVQGDRLVLVILTDHGHKITKAQAEAVLRQIGGR